MNALFATKGRLARKTDAETKDAAPAQKPAGWHRMQSDLHQIDLPDNVKLEMPNKEDVMNFLVTVTPSAGFWKGATFQFKFAVPDDYPYTPPKITCLDKVP